MVPMADLGPIPRARVHLDAPLSTISAYLTRKNENEKYSGSVRLQAVGSRLIAWRSGLSLVELLLEGYDYGVFLLQLPFQTVVYSQHYRVHGILAAGDTLVHYRKLVARDSEAPCLLYDFQFDIRFQRLACQVKGQHIRSALGDAVVVDIGFSIYSVAADEFF